MKVYYNYWSVVIEDLEGISLAKIRKFYQEFLLKVRFLMPGDVVDRCVQDGFYYLINGHGGLRDDRLYKFILTLFDSYNLEYEAMGLLTADLETLLSIHFPVRIGPGMYTGGTPGKVNLTIGLGVDSGIKPFCDVINDIGGFTTIASCEGHGLIASDECLAYVMFSTTNVDNLSKITTILKNADNELYDERIVLRSLFLSDFQDNLVYKFDIEYFFKDQLKAFEYIREISSIIYNKFNQ